MPAPLNTAAARLDETDRKVLEVLSRDGRASYAEIGLLVNLSATAVKRRVDRLRERGVVRGFTVVLDPGSLEWRTEAFVEVYWRERTSPEEILAALRQFPEVVAAWTVTGEADALVHLRAADTGHLEAVIERIRRERGVQRSRSQVVLSRLIG
ncbi:Lrp/AsnC family transcriptional regulator [Streptacidiphilus carbonis]|uniref:Lrp/AsnC family transcriptional regulator n=1 Tax=Streptacidiphilus carbonis TaxID=105422 RepID=UPI000AE1F18C|nr:Lrp/AsnC family transcriptional regulator [Streptacidiphilus carbonis]